MRLLLMIPSFLIWVPMFLVAIDAGLSKKDFYVGISAFVIFCLCLIFEIRSYRKTQHLIKSMDNNRKILSKSFDKLLEATTSIKNK